MSETLSDHKDKFARINKQYIDALQKPNDAREYGDFLDLAHYSFDIACYDYFFNKDISKFHDLLSLIPDYIFAAYRLSLKSEKNDIIGWNWADIFHQNTYLFIFYSLMDKNYIGAKQIAKWMLANDFFEKMPTVRDDYYFGYCLLYLLTNDEKFWSMLSKLRKKKHKRSQAFTLIYEGIVEKDEKRAQSGIDALVKVMNSKWEDSHTGFINTWALGLANLCRLHGVMVHESKQPVPPSIIPPEEVQPQVPEELLAKPEEVQAALKQDPTLGILPPQ